MVAKSVFKSKNGREILQPPGSDAHKTLQNQWNMRHCKIWAPRCKIWEPRFLQNLRTMIWIGFEVPNKISQPSRKIWAPWRKIWAPWRKIWAPWRKNSAPWRGPQKAERSSQRTDLEQDPKSRPWAIDSSAAQPFARQKPVNLRLPITSAIFDCHET